MWNLNLKVVKLANILHLVFLKNSAHFPHIYLFTSRSYSSSSSVCSSHGSSSTTRTLASTCTQCADALNKTYDNLNLTEIRGVMIPFFSGIGTGMGIGANELESKLHGIGTKVELIPGLESFP